MYHVKRTSLGKAQALPINIRLGWKGLQGTNTVAFYKYLLFTEEKVSLHWAQVFQNGMK